MKKFFLVIALIVVGKTTYGKIGFDSGSREFEENGIPFIENDPSDFVQPSRSIASIGNSEDETDSKFESVIDEDTPVTHDKIAGEKNLTGSRSWKPSQFNNQNKALGYDESTFKVPDDLKIAVKFWQDIYSKYHSDQGVIHDADYIDLIYEEIDFTQIASRADLNLFQKEALKTKMVKEAKKRVVTMLSEFDKMSETDVEGLSPEKKQIWEYFKKIEGKDKFLAASKKNRLRFQLGQRDRMIQGIFFSGRYLEEFEVIFKEAGLPLELTRLPFVESSFNVLARSKVGASGLWQIMPYTSKGYMKKDASIDLRNHPTEATKLAAKLLKNNYDLLQSWPLALTGYNHGPHGVLRLTKKFQSRDIGELVKQKAFGFASRNFYASFLAALEISSNAPKYLGAVTWSKTLEAKDIKLPVAIKYSELLKWFDEDDLRAQVYNPHITKLGRDGKKMIPAGFVVSIPQSKDTLVQKELEELEKTRANEKFATKVARLPNTSNEKKRPGSRK